jgi:hypothetical protein
MVARESSGAVLAVLSGLAAFVLGCGGGTSPSVVYLERDTPPIG